MALANWGVGGRESGILFCRILHGRVPARWLIKRGVTRLGKEIVYQKEERYEE
jgi:hypothetical protein